MGTDTQSAASLDGPRCQHHYKNGKRCRLSGSEPQFGLCPSHFRQRIAAGLPPTDDSSDLSTELLRSIEFSSAEDLRAFLTRLLIQMAKGRVSPRRASVLAYITTQLLHTHVAAEKESDQPQPFIFDLPRPKRYDDVISPERDYLNRMAELATRAATPVAPDGYDGYTSNPCGTDAPPVSAPERLK
jgi:hypothetical protein